MEKEFKLYLVRHGETYLNKFKRMQGWSDTPLTEEGIQTAIQCGKKLSDIPFASVYTSDLRRTVETATIIMKQNVKNDRFKINERIDFREAFFGSLEGERIDNVAENIIEEHSLDYSGWDELYRRVNIEKMIDWIRKLDCTGYAESTSDIWQRVETGLDEMVEESRADENILLVCHGAIIKLIINRFSGGKQFTEEIKNASVSILKYNNGGFRVLSYNQ